jgi:hypothetical protein
MTAFCGECEAPLPIGRPFAHIMQGASDLQEAGTWKTLYLISSS